MEIYFFFKKYYRAMWHTLALFLSQRGVTANAASISSLFFIIPIFLGIHIFFPLGTWYWILLFFAINIKLILNAIDGIIAEDQKSFTQTWRYLNVGTDIFPDIFIIYLLLSKLAVEVSITTSLCIIMLLYLWGEFLYIHLRKEQNLFFGKEMRVIFYFLIFGIYMWGYNMMFWVYIYLIFFLIHNVWFFRK